MIINISSDLNQGTRRRLFKERIQLSFRGDVLVKANVHGK